MTYCGCETPRPAPTEESCGQCGRLLGERQAVAFVTLEECVALLTTVATTPCEHGPLPECPRLAAQALLRRYETQL